MDDGELDPVATIGWLKDSYDMLGRLMRDIALEPVPVRKRRILKVDNIPGRSKSKTSKKIA